MNPIAKKAVKLSGALRPSTNRICINLDGILYSRRTAKRLSRLLNSLEAYQLIVSVSDTRFVPRDGAIEWIANSHSQNCKPKIIKKGKHAVRLYS